MTLRVAALAFDGCFGTELFGLGDLLAMANDVSAAVRPGTAQPFRLSVVSVAGRPVTLAGGTVLRPQVATTRIDHLVVPGFTFSDPATAPARLAQWGAELDFLRTFAPRATEVSSLCTGAFLVAEAGLLDGQTATTAWLFAPELARRYPLVNVQAAEVVVRDGRVRSAGAFTAYQDLALHLIEEHAGHQVARVVSRLTLLGAPRASQSPYVEPSLLPVQHSGFGDDVQRWLRANLAKRYDLERLAAVFGVSTRTLLRRFAAETGQSPLEFLQTARVTAARRLLEYSELPVAAITREVGYRDMAAFRALFVARTGVTPSAYRRSFHSTAA